MHQGHSASRSRSPSLASRNGKGGALAGTGSLFVRATHDIDDSSSPVRGRGTTGPLADVIAEMVDTTDEEEIASTVVDDSSVASLATKTLPWSSRNEPLVPPSMVAEPEELRAPPLLPASFPRLPEELLKVADAVNKLDEGTPDGWIKRDGRLIRLTGKHPFSELFRCVCDKQEGANRAKTARPRFKRSSMQDSSLHRPSSSCATTARSPR